MLMSEPNPQHQNFISGYASAINAMLDARATLKSYRERDAATGIVAALTPDDFAGINAPFSQQAITDAFGAMDQLEMLLTDFTKTPPEPTPLLAHLLKFRS
jgi:hypothetical protein